MRWCLSGEYDSMHDFGYSLSSHFSWSSKCKAFVGKILLSENVMIKISTKDYVVYQPQICSWSACKCQYIENKNDKHLLLNKKYR